MKKTAPVQMGRSFCADAIYKRQAVTGRAELGRFSTLHSGHPGSEHCHPDGATRPNADASDKKTIANIK